MWTPVCGRLLDLLSATAIKFSSFFTGDGLSSLIFATAERSCKSPSVRGFEVWGADVAPVRAEGVRWGRGQVLVQDARDLPLAPSQAASPWSSLRTQDSISGEEPCMGCHSRVSTFGLESVCVCV